jgi:NAD(P)-dependent dehydrogenase (short-subunit alcohol dehydrogenase family)
MKQILITGASGGLGKTVVEYFVEKNYQVVAAVRHEQSTSELPPNKNLLVDVVDLSDPIAASAFINRCITHLGKIDAALLLAGGFASGDIQNTDINAIRKQFSTNFETAYNVVQPLFQHMLDNKYGRIILIGSRPALEPKAGKDLIAYSLSKSLLFKLAEFLNAAAKGTNVTCTVMAPGTIDTAENRKAMPGADSSKWVSPQKIAAIIDFILSDNAEPLRETVLKLYSNG